MDEAACADSSYPSLWRLGASFWMIWNFSIAPRSAMRPAEMKHADSLF